MAFAKGWDYLVFVALLAPNDIKKYFMVNHRSLSRLIKKKREM